MKLNAKELRTQPVDLDVAKSIQKNPIYVVLDNVLDTYNIGAIFRLADAVAAQKVYLCGQTETPPNPKIKKASINTWQWVQWEYAENAAEVIRNMKNNSSSWRPRGVQDRNNGSESVGDSGRARSSLARMTGRSTLQIIAVEQSEKSIPLSQLKPEFPVAVVVGNETYGVSEAVLEMADTIVELPMFGINRSLNVMVSCGIVLYTLIAGIHKNNK